MYHDGFLGFAVISKHGHDKGNYYIITKVVDGNFVLVSNGENRPLENPKRKNISHLFVTNYRTAATNDNEIKKALLEFKKRSNE